MTPENAPFTNMEDKLTEEMQKAIDEHFAHMDRIGKSLDDNLRRVSRTVSAELARRRRQGRIDRILGDEAGGDAPGA